MSEANVYIVDDDPGVRESLALLLDLHGFKAECFADAETFLAARGPGTRGCAILDLRMSGMTGTELQSEMARRGMVMPVVVVTAHGDVPATRAAFKAGAIDFLEKPIDPDALVRAVETGLARDAALRERAERAGEAASRLALLTGREREVVESAVTGLHNREIATDLGISPRTVEVYKARAMEKLGVKRLPDLVRLVMTSRGEVD